ncbi:MAG: hypothetical protein RI935_148 [Candidatus Parcubacteria bacterium]|jgi:hypothetical protein
MHIATPSIKNSLLIAVALFVCISSQLYVSAANLIVSPSSVSTSVGRTFKVDFNVTNNTEAINAVSLDATFPKDALEVISISKTGSFMSLWAEEPTFSNEKGTISLEGVALNPGYSKATGKVITVTFKAKEAGNVSIVIKEGAVLLNDGNATDVLKTTGSALVYIGEEGNVVEKEPVELSLPVITSPTHPDSTAWYSRRDASFEWKISSNVTSVRTVYSDKETDNPSRVYTPPVASRSFTVDEDGIFYMKVQFKNADGWGAVSTYKFQIDTQAPTIDQATFPDGSVTTNITPSLVINSSDTLSGIKTISLSIDGGQAIEMTKEDSGIYRLPRQSPGKHTVIITVTDQAGNSSTASLDYTIQAINPPLITEYSRKVEFDSQLKVVGASYPNSRVEVTLTNKNGEALIRDVTTDEVGVFSLTWKDKIPSGVYEMKVRVFDSKGAVSDFTNIKVIEVERMLLLRFGIFVMNWLSVILIIVIALLAVIATLWYAFVQFNLFRRNVKRKLREVENTLEMNVSALRRDVEEFHDVLVKAEKKRELTKEEQAIMKKFKKRLEVIEQEIEKKLEEAIK